MNKSSLYFYVFMFFVAGSVQAMDFPDYEMAWAMSERTLALGISVGTIQEELDAGFISIYDEEGRDYGYSQPNINPLQLECLEDIRRLYEQNGKKRIPAIDIGAATGLMSWKMIVAGAHVTAVEIVSRVADQILNNVLQKSSLSLIEKKLHPYA